MGSFAKALGQLAAKSMQSESAFILKTTSANKRGISLLLDATLRDGHDMTTFGLGTAASLASRERYTRFTTSLHGVYSAMESSLDASASPPVRLLWDTHSGALRRAPALAADLAEMGVHAEVAQYSPATRDYVSALSAAAADDDATGGGRLLGHVYCRYFADLFGGQALATPTRCALGLGPGSPRQYDFGAFVAGRRREAIESIYVSLNAAGEAMPTDDHRGAAVLEARKAFRLNVVLYAEEGRLWPDAARGAAKVLGGWAVARVRGARG